MAPAGRGHSVKRYHIKSSTTGVRVRTPGRCPRSVKKPFGIVKQRNVLKDLITRSKELPTNWQYKDGFCYFKNRLYIPADDSLKTKIAKGCYNSKVAGHFGMEKTIEIIIRDFYWKGLTEWIYDYVQSCDECQHNKSPQHAR